MKPYTWDDIKNFLINELKKTKHILTFGTIGSCNIEHDIDTIITKKSKSKSSDFYKEIHDLFDKLNDYINKKYGVKVIRLPNISYEKELLKLSDYNKYDLVFHTMIYVSYPQIKKDWGWALSKEENINNILKGYKCLIGSVNDLFSTEFKKPNNLDHLFIFLNLYDRINSNYSEEFLLETMNDYYDYLYRKNLKLKTPVAKNKEEIRDIFYKLCDILDKLNKEKK